MADKTKFKVGDEVKQVARGNRRSFGFYSIGVYDPFMDYKGGETIFEVTDNTLCGNLPDFVDVALRGDDGSRYFADSDIFELVNPPVPEKMVTVVSEDGTEKDWSMSTIREALREHAK